MRDDGGQAFPVSAEHPTAGPYMEPGMTLRQWYKGMALAGMCASTDRQGTHRVYAQDAAAFADAMLAEDREGEKYDSK